MPAWQKKLTGYQTLDPCWSKKEHEYYSISTVQLLHFIQKYTKLTNISDTESFHRPGQQNYVHRMNKGRVPSWKPLGDQRSDRGEELVQIERQRVELCAPRVFLVAPELVPPVVAPVLPRVFHLYRVVQDVGHEASDEGLRWERHINHVVELSDSEEKHQLICHSSSYQGEWQKCS